MPCKPASPRLSKRSALLPRRTSAVCALLSLVSALMLSACATSSPSVSVAPQRQLEIPRPPVVTPPPPSGTYWQRYCELRQRLQERLSVTLPTSESCSTLGQPNEAPPVQGRKEAAQAPRL